MNPSSNESSNTRLRRASGRAQAGGDLQRTRGDGGRLSCGRGHLGSSLLPAERPAAAQIDVLGKTTAKAEETGLVSGPLPAPVFSK